MEIGMEIKIRQMKKLIDDFPFIGVFLFPYLFFKGRTKNT